MHIDICIYTYIPKYSLFGSYNATCMCFQGWRLCIGQPVCTHFPGVGLLSPPSFSRLSTVLCVELRLCFLTHWEDSFPWTAAAACPYCHPASSPWRLQKNASTELWPTSTSRFSIPLTLVALFSMPSKFPFRMYCSHQLPDVVIPSTRTKISAVCPWKVLVLAT